MDDVMLEASGAGVTELPSRENDYVGLLETALMLVEGSKP